jgi:hypothetical protein
MFLPEPERMERDQNLGKPPSQIQRNDLKRYRCTEGKWSWDKREARIHWPIVFLPPNPDNWKLPFSAQCDGNQYILGDAQNTADKATLISSEELAA